MENYYPRPFLGYFAQNSTFSLDFEFFVNEQRFKEKKIEKKKNFEENWLINPCRFYVLPACVGGGMHTAFGFARK